MKNSKKRVILTLGIAGIIFLGIFVVVTQYQIFVINKKEEGQPLFLKVFADKTEGLIPMSVNFSALVDYYEGDLKYEWDFGNGDTSKEKSPTIIYDENGEYVCSLKITDIDDNTKTDSINIIAKKNKPPVVTLKINQNTISRKFLWRILLSLIPMRALKYAGNHQKMLDGIEERHGTNALGEGRLIVTAQISDPEDDEIVTYEWTEQTADTLVTAGGKELLPIHNLTGNESVRIPELYTWIPDRHIVTLTVTDSAGNKASSNIDYTVSQSINMTKIQENKKLFTALLLTTVPQLTNQIWVNFPKIRENLTSILDNIWLDLGPFWQKLLTRFLNVFRLDYDPPISKADLVVTTIDDIDLSAYVNDTTGEVENEASASSTFTITNNDTENIAQNIYISLYNPFSEDEGLDDEIEKEELIVSIERLGGTTSNSLFYNGEYTNWQNCFFIEELAPGSSYTLDLSVLLKEGGAFNQGTYDSCTLYIYQEKSLDIAEYIDEIPFTIIL